MTDSRILIACIGNIFLGDDGFGTEVARRLTAESLPPEVVLKDFGIRGLDLTYALLDPYELVILADACSRGNAPGTVYVIEPYPIESGESDIVCAPLEAHGMNPMKVLRMVHSMGVKLGRVLLVGCEPEFTGSDEEGRLGLSAPVQSAVDEAVIVIKSLIAKALDGQLAEMAIESH